MSKGLFNIAGKTACVTGASAGIGRHIAQYFVKNGVHVVGVARREEALQNWQADCLKANSDNMNAGKADYVIADLSDQQALDKTAKSVLSIRGGVDILINAAGINTRQNADDVTRDGWQMTMDLNLSTPFFLAQAFVPHMKKNKWGRIINFASMQSYRAFPAGIAYGTSKGGIAQMTRAMAEAWSKEGITANAIGPGFFETELTKPVFSDEARAKRNADQTCIGRNGELDDLEGPIHFLSSDASRFVTGIVMMVDGGFTAK